MGVEFDPSSAQEVAFDPSSAAEVPSHIPASEHDLSGDTSIDFRTKENRDAGVAVARGAVKGVVSPFTFAADIGGGIGNIARKATGNAPGITDVGTTAINKTLDSMGLTMGDTPGASGAEAAMDMATGLGTMPGAAVKATKALPTLNDMSKLAGDGYINNQVLNRSWRAALGLADSVAPITGEEAGKADKAIGNIFDLARSQQYVLPEAARSPRVITNMLDSIEATAGSPEFKNNPIVRNMVKKLVSTGQVDNEQLGNFASQLRGAASAALDGKTPNYALYTGLTRMRNYAEDLIQAGLPNALQQSYAVAKQQYRALMQLTDSGSGTWNTASGKIDGAALGRFLQRTERQGYALANDTSQQFAATKAVQYGAGNQSLVDNVASSGKLGVIKSALQTIPGALQVAKQYGYNAAIRTLSSSKEGIARLSAAIASAEGGDSSE